LSAGSTSRVRSRSDEFRLAPQRKDPRWKLQPFTRATAPFR
jgi:hypothetical protein